MSMAKPCKVENFKTKKIRNFENVTLACKALKINYNTVCNNISKLKQAKKWKGYILVKNDTMAISITDTVKRCEKCNQII